jgi:transposase
MSIDPNEVVRLYVDEKWSVRAIAQHFNSSYGKIYGMLRRRVAMRRAGEKSPGDHRHERIAEILRDRIIAGEWKPGHKLLSQEALAGIFGVGPQTVNRAIASLATRGYLHTLPNKGTYVRPPLDWETSTSSR